MNKKKITSSTLGRAITSWFKRNKRELPWRDYRTPYSVWISEIMLQQTVVKTVIPYFKKWMIKYPDVSILACASEQEVIRSWEGLGYYSRARNILKAARIIVNEHGGQIPSGRNALMSLPGIGEYTSSAILSIAFNHPYPVADANVKRVIRRLLGMIKFDKEDEKKLNEFLRNAIPAKQPGNFNEGLMELGQRICLPLNPLCNECPLSRNCQAKIKELQNDIPQNKQNPKIRKSSTVMILLSGACILLEQRKGKLLDDMWGLPRIDNNYDINGYLGRFGKTKFRIAGELKPRYHYYTRYAEHLKPVVLELQPNLENLPKNCKWVKFDKIDSYPFPSVYRRILSDLEEFLKKRNTQPELY